MELQFLGLHCSHEFISALIQKISQEKLGTIGEYSAVRKYLKSTITQLLNFKQVEKGTKVDVSVLGLNYILALILEKDELMKTDKIDIILNMDSRSNDGNSFTPITARFGTFSQMSLFLCQLALINGTESDALKTLSEVLNELEKIETLKFGQFEHKINIKMVLDFSAIWKLLRRKMFKIKESSRIDKLDIEFITKNEDGNHTCVFEEHKGCPFCIASRKCVNNCKRNRNFQKKESKDECKQCYGRYNNFGVFEFNPDMFIFLNGLPADSFVPCTIHLDKNVVVRLLQPFAKMSFQLTNDFKMFNDVCNKVFGEGRVYAEKSKNRKENEENTIFTENSILIATGYRNDCLEIIEKLGKFVDAFSESVSLKSNRKNLFRNEKNLDNYVELLEYYFKEMINEDVSVVNVPLLEGGRKRVDLNEEQKKFIKAFQKEMKSIICGFKLENSEKLDVVLESQFNVYKMIYELTADFIFLIEEGIDSKKLKRIEIVRQDTKLSPSHKNSFQTLPNDSLQNPSTHLDPSQSSIQFPSNQAPLQTISEKNSQTTPKIKIKISNNEDFFPVHYYLSIFVAKSWRNIQKGDIGGDYIHFLFEHGSTFVNKYGGLSKYNLQAAEKNQSIQKGIEKSKIFPGNISKEEGSKEQIRTKKILVEQYLSLFMNIDQLLRKLNKKQEATIINKKNISEEKKELRDTIISSKTERINLDKEDQIFYLKSSYPLGYWSPEQFIVKCKSIDLEFFSNVKSFFFQVLQLNRIYDRNFWSSGEKSHNHVIEPSSVRPDFSFSKIFLKYKDPNQRRKFTNEHFEKLSKDDLLEGKRDVKDDPKISEKSPSKKQKTILSSTSVPLQVPIPKLSFDNSPQGFVNEGGYSCFENSVLQCLFSSKIFTDFLKNQKFNINQKIWLALQDLFSQYQFQILVITPKEFKKVFTDLHFRVGDQQDVGEFLQTLLEDLEKELAIISDFSVSNSFDFDNSFSNNINSPRPFSPIFEFKYLDIPQFDDDRSLKISEFEIDPLKISDFEKEPFFISEFEKIPFPTFDFEKDPKKGEIQSPKDQFSDMFQGTIISSNLHTCCSHLIQNTEHFKVLEINDPDTHHCHLKFLIQDFQLPTTFISQCPKCKEQTTVQKQKLITSYPKILIVHLNRNVRKIILNTNVYFGEKIDIKITNGNVSLQHNSSSFRSGTKDFGHNSSSIKFENSWWYIDDEKVTKKDRFHDHETKLFFFSCETNIDNKPQMDVVKKQKKVEETYKTLTENKTIENVPKFSFGITEKDSNEIKLLLQKSSNHVFVERFGCEITVYDLNRLKINGYHFRESSYYLNDEIINYYLALIIKRNKKYKNLPKVHFFNSFFYENLVKGIDNVKKWEKKFDQFFNLDFLFIPINISNIHWTLVVVNFKSKKICYYDSLYGKNKGCLELITTYLQKRKSGFDKQIDLNDNWTASFAKNIPKQTNGYDCGIFVLLYALFLSCKLPFNFKQTEIVKYRDLILYHIFKGEIT